LLQLALDRNTGEKVAIKFTQRGEAPIRTPTALLHGASPLELDITFNTAALPAAKASTPFASATAEAGASQLL